VDHWRHGDGGVGLQGVDARVDRTDSLRAANQWHGRRAYKDGMGSNVGDVFSPLASIEPFLDGWLSRLPADRPVALRDAMRYSTLGAGKRLRPILAWHACEAVGGTGSDSLAAGCAIELVHAFSLIHDDLPALDNDDIRRGKPTLHKHAGEAMAILAGDQLLTDAFLLLSTSPAVGRSELRAELVGELACATSGMISGQVYDTLGGSEVASDAARAELERVQIVHRNKTGALIRAACRMGAMCGLSNLPDSSLRAVTAYGEAMGLMFQAVDDLIDVTQTAEVAGKATGKDAHLGKLTYPGVLGIEGTRAQIAHLQAGAVDALSPLGERAHALRRLADLMANRTS
jgi:geranylgeranyl diphosphate synthase, type II